MPCILGHENAGWVHEVGSAVTNVQPGDTVQAVADLTGGRGANVVLDFVGEQGAEMDGWTMTGPAGYYFVMTEFGSLDEGLKQPSPDSSMPQSLGYGPSVG